jgi:hypothetical protein
MKLFSLLSVSLLLIVISCDQFDELTHFNLEYNQTIVIPSMGNDLPDDLEIPEIETDYETSLAGYQTNSDLIEEVILSESTLTITTPTDGDFSFLKSIAIYISANDMEEIKVAWQDTILESGSSLDLECSDTDLTQYITKDSFNVRVNTIIQEFINEEYQIDLLNNFYVDAEILGQ